LAKKQLSGAAKRKIAREKARAAEAEARARGDYVPRPGVMGRLETVGDIAREIRRVFHDARMGTLPTDHASKLAFVGTQALKATEVETQIAQQAAVIRALQASREGTLLESIPSPDPLTVVVEQPAQPIDRAEPEMVPQ
jgi:hypothetical protein